jgi:hypothetical protein
VYPVGIETVLPGMTPGPGRTMLFEFTTLYSANEFVDGHGKTMATEFKLSVFANAFRAEHGWNAHFWGGTLVSNVAVPLIYQQLYVLPGKFTQFGVGNIGIGVLGVGYHRRNPHWFSEADIWLRGIGYSSANALNIGQHNCAAGPVAGFTYLSDRGKLEMSSRVPYIGQLPEWRHAVP